MDGRQGSRRVVRPSACFLVAGPLRWAVQLTLGKYNPSLIVQLQDGSWACLPGDEVPLHGALHAPNGRWPSAYGWPRR